MYKNPTSIELRAAKAMHFWRTFNGLTKAESARRVGVLRQSWSLWENGHRGPSLPQIFRICAALNVSPYIFFLTMEAFQ